MSQGSAKEAGISDIQSARSIEVRGHCVGTLVSWTEEGPRVDFAGNPHGPLVARSFVAAAAPPAPGQPVLLVFEGERSHRPILVGLCPPPGLPVVEAVVDGQRVVVEGRDEIVLRCGHASITLRRNGRVIVRGTYVETRSEGVNRIKGGTVRIN